MKFKKSLKKALISHHSAEVPSPFSSGRYGDTILEEVYFNKDGRLDRLHRLILKCKISWRPRSENNTSNIISGKVSVYSATEYLQYLGLALHLYWIKLDPQLDFDSI